MDAPGILDRRGQYFLLKYRPSAARDEGRNIGVALVAEAGGYAALKHLPPSQLAPKLREQGILDAALVAIGRAISEHPAAAFEQLRVMSGLHGPVVVGPAMPADLGAEPQRTLGGLFHGLVGQPTARRPGIAKSRLLDKVVDTFRHSGAPVRRGEYLDDFLMDAIVAPSSAPITAVHAQSFAQAHRDWARTERETGYFLFAVETLGTQALCVLQPPTEIGGEGARRSFERVDRWLDRAGVRSVSPAELTQVAQRFGPEEQLPLLMA